jgi:predicted nucleic acid-binding protein
LHPIYDCFYLSLAEAEDALVVTNDKRLLAKLQGTDLSGRAIALDAAA